MKGLSEPLYYVFLERIYKLGYTAVEHESRSQPVEIYKDKEYICSLMQDGAFHFKPGTGVDSDVHGLSDILLSMKPLYELYENAAYLSFKGVEKYKLLCEFGDALLAVRLDDDHELRFVTWMYDYRHEGVMHTKYFDTDYSAAKQNFAIRCGLVDEKRLFDEKELVALYDACVYRGSHDETLSSDNEKLLQGLVQKLECVLPELSNTEQEQEQEKGMEV